MIKSVLYCLKEAQKLSMSIYCEQCCCILPFAHSLMTRWGPLFLYCYGVIASWHTIYHNVYVVMCYIVSHVTNMMAGWWAWVFLIVHLQDIWVSLSLHQIRKLHHRLHRHYAQGDNLKLHVQTGRISPNPVQMSNECVKASCGQVSGNINWCKQRRHRGAI